MSPLRLTGSTSGYSQLDAPAVAGDQTFTLPGTGGTLDRLNRAGNILQVVSANFDTAVTSSSSTFADVGLSASITPSSASNKVLVMVNLCGCGKITGNTALAAHVADSSNNVLFDLEGIGGATAGTTSNYFGSISRTFLHSPATTSSFTYKVRFASAANVATVYINDFYTAGFDSDSTITLMEVAA